MHLLYSPRLFIGGVLNFPISLDDEWTLLFIPTPSYTFNAKSKQIQVISYKIKKIEGYFSRLKHKQNKETIPAMSSITLKNRIMQTIPLFDYIARFQTLTPEWVCNSFHPKCNRHIIQDTTSSSVLAILLISNLHSGATFGFKYLIGMYKLWLLGC